ncbi:arginine methyltransferase-interacting ring finger protein [Niveomyces insectorum RCEF 264]|uniref:Arginine methyltransferase-interacting ring finger protein n=1 Tax=Niveomyces insectorum RCEF 264 TaxID=1081102 RepID=A0A168A2I2_9HYPO|nr:arginine methyltransferase-interacting ring finger protein [Niveomyces insectorum RCEF 264]
MEEHGIREYGVLWRVPPLPLPGPSGEPLGPHSFEDWCRSFVRLNKQDRQTLAVHDLTFPLKAYTTLLNEHRPEQWIYPAPVERYRRIAWDSYQCGAMTEAVVAELDLARSEVLQTKRLDAAQAHELHTYFPGVPDDAVFCLSCACLGHRAETCPLRTCRFCGANDGTHLSFGCPTATATATAVTNAAKETADPGRPLSRNSCLACSSQSHDADDCRLLWTTYVPASGGVRTAGAPFAFCYACGARDHATDDGECNGAETAPDAPQDLLPRRTADPAGLAKGANKPASKRAAKKAAKLAKQEVVARTPEEKRSLKRARRKEKRLKLSNTFAALQDEQPAGSAADENGHTGALHSRSVQSAQNQLPAQNGAGEPEPQKKKKKKKEKEKAKREQSKEHQPVPATAVPQGIADATMATPTEPASAPGTAGTVRVQTEQSTRSRRYQLRAHSGKKHGQQQNGPDAGAGAAHKGRKKGRSTNRGGQRGRGPGRDGGSVPGGGRGGGRNA